jgi:glycosyltransferase involved in cell wall biosynthesis
MKILQDIPFFSPLFGGSVTVAYDLSKELAKRDHEVTIITSVLNFDPHYADTIRSEGVTVISFHCIANLWSFLYTPSLKVWLEKKLKEFDIVHLHNFRSYQNAIVRPYAMKYGIPYIMQAHGSVLPFFEKQNLKKLYDFFWGKKTLNDAAKLIAVSYIEKDQYLKMGIPENKIVIIENGIDVSKYETLPERGKFKKRFGIPSEKKIILYLGRLHKRKGIDFIIDGFSLLSDQDVLLVIAGPDDGYRNALVQRTNKLRNAGNVLFVEELSNEQKNEAFVDADVLVYPERMEIFGLVPFEALMCGTPVIVSDDSGCGEIVKRVNCGLLVKFGDSNQLKDQINLLINNPKIVDIFQTNGQAYIQKNLNWADLIEKFEHLYDSCSKTANIIHTKRL